MDPADLADVRNIVHLLRHVGAVSRSEAVARTEFGAERHRGGSAPKRRAPHRGRYTTCPIAASLTVTGPDPYRLVVDRAWVWRMSTKTSRSTSSPLQDDSTTRS